MTKKSKKQKKAQRKQSEWDRSRRESKELPVDDAAGVEEGHDRSPSPIAVIVDEDGGTRRVLASPPPTPVRNVDPIDDLLLFSSTKKKKKKKTKKKSGNTGRSQGDSSDVGISGPESAASAFTTPILQGHKGSELDTFSPLSSTTPLSSAVAERLPSEVQTEELEALTAIFGDDLDILSSSSPVAFSIRVAPHTGDAKNNHCAVKTVIQYVVDYPNKPPIIKLEAIEGLSDTALAELQKQAEAKVLQLCQRRQEIIFELIQQVQELLVPHNRKQMGSFYEEMMERKAAADQEYSRIQLEQARKAKETAEREKNALKGQIEAELAWRAELRKEQKQKKNGITRKTSEDENQLVGDLHELGEVEQNFHFYVPSAFASRYRSDFEELEELGRGAAGEVVKVRNKIDKLCYAIKKIKLNANNPALNQKILREVTLLSRLQHQYIVRYYQAWIEGAEGTTISDDDSNQDGDDSIEESSEEEDWLGADRSLRHNDRSFGSNVFFEEGNSEDQEGWSDDDDSAISDSDSESSSEKKSSVKGTERAEPKMQHVLYIQMEHCAGETLRTVIDSKKLTASEIWRMFRQIVEALAHIHSRGMIHRDLKPPNIFLDSQHNIKVGDLGLATTAWGLKRETTRGSILTPPTLERETSATSDYSFGANNRADSGLLHSATGDSLSVGVGTPFYRSPEQEKGHRYDQKCDLYALGIIFFELWQPFDTLMERAVSINNLRNSMVFPEGFERRVPKTVPALIRWMCALNPKERPTAMELLQSEYMPLKFEDEALNDLLRAIANPRTTESLRLMQALFGKQNPPHMDFTFDVETKQRKLSTIESAVRTRVLNKAVSIFQRHGAVAVDIPLLQPKSVLSGSHPHSPVLMDPTGTLVQLPFNLTEPFARYIGRQTNVSLLKRYSTGKIFRSNAAGGHPREIHECEFDIVWEGSVLSAGGKGVESMMEAEVVKCCVEVLQTFVPYMGQCTVLVNDSRLVNQILVACGVKKQQRRELTQALVQMARRPWAELREHLAENFHFNAKNLDRLGSYLNIRGEFSSVVKTLHSRTIGREQTVTQILDSLAVFFSCCEMFGLTKEQVQLDLGLIAEPELYQSGFMFQVVVKSNRSKAGEKESKLSEDCVASGGRFDSLISRFEYVGTQQPSLSAVGVGIAVDKIVSAVSTHEKASQYQRHADVFVCSIGEQLQSDRLKLVSQLWAADIKAEYSLMDGTSLEVVQDYCKKEKIPWLIIIKKSTFTATGRVKLKHMDQKFESDLSPAEVCDFLVAEQRGQAMSSKTRHGQT
eukprot:GILK01011388.1.p1 GENE.GILK01011388.1~~GILK01011388.1.p1  ORF type:complete len:1281 (-),score=268.78 GILK01011388.1:111-3953(-)